DHIHNNIVIHSVNLETGKKFQADIQSILGKCNDKNEEKYVNKGINKIERRKKEEKRTKDEIKLKKKQDTKNKDDRSYANV
ncbi:relaxase/mobilization nuclease domain-containing protein, partial [Enterococcus lactis]